MLKSTCVHTKTLYMVVCSYELQSKYDQKKYALTLLLSSNSSTVFFTFARNKSNLRQVILRFIDVLNLRMQKSWLRMMKWWCKCSCGRCKMIAKHKVLSMDSLRMKRKFTLISFIYQILTVIYVLYDNMENCSTTTIKYVSRNSPYNKWFTAKAIRDIYPCLFWYRGMGQ